MLSLTCSRRSCALSSGERRRKVSLALESVRVTAAPDNPPPSIPQIHNHLHLTSSPPVQGTLRRRESPSDTLQGGIATDTIHNSALIAHKALRTDGVNISSLFYIKFTLYTALEGKNYFILLKIINSPPTFLYIMVSSIQSNSKRAFPALGCRTGSICGRHFSGDPKPIGLYGKSRRQDGSCNADTLANFLVYVL